VSVMIVGDFNIDPSNSATIQDAIVVRGWHNVAVRISEIAGQPIA